MHGQLSEVSVDGVTRARYWYNYLGQQVLREVTQPGLTLRTVSVFDQWGHRIAEYDSASGTLLREYIWLEDRPIAVIEGGDIFYIHVDHISRPVMATDASGAVVWSATYTPYGGIHSVNVDTGALSAQELRFPGQWFQAETGFHQNWHRTYDPTLGRYLEPDPLGLVDGPSVYGYARQSPMRYIDPTGECLPGLVAGAIAGSIAGYVNSGCYEGAILGAIIGGATGSLGASSGLLSASGAATGLAGAGFGGIAGNFIGNLQKYGYACDCSPPKPIRDLLTSPKFILTTLGGGLGGGLGAGFGGGFRVAGGGGLAEKAARGIFGKPPYINNVKFNRVRKVTEFFEELISGAGARAGEAAGSGAAGFTGD